MPHSSRKKTRLETIVGENTLNRCVAHAIWSIIMADPVNSRKQLFLAALEIASLEERESFLRRECGGDEPLRLEIQALLEAHGAADSFLEKPAAAMGTTMDASRVACPVSD